MYVLPVIAAPIAVALIFMILGYLMKKGNRGVHLNTAESRKSEASAMLADKIGGKMMFTIGIACLPVSMAVMFLCSVFGMHDMIAMAIAVIAEMTFLAYGMIKANGIVRGFNSEIE